MVNDYSLFQMSLEKSTQAEELSLATVIGTRRSSQQALAVDRSRDRYLRETRRVFVTSFFKLIWNRL